ncbi:hypothetical protein INT47_008226 [Mucor saturninus]|uniref:Uncharacterized protein n=1 Tax=Mucor saturninus TaxID=64648 RepID=A0A8H7V6Y1_9FUNG|nr:hypothetical protein INT47_008226 [Mucor saturninus]
MAKVKKEGKSKIKELAKDIVWCEKNVKTLTPQRYFEKFNITDRHYGHRRYNNIIISQVSKNYKKTLKEEFQTWRSGPESSKFWEQQLKKKSISESSYQATKFATTQTLNVYKAMNTSSLNDESDTENDNTINQDSENDHDTTIIDKLDDSDLLVEVPSFLSDDKYPDANCSYWCLQGEGSEEWSSGKNFKQLRKESFSAALNLERISSVRILTLSHIFVISPTTEQSITSLTPIIHEDLLAQTDVFRRMEIPIEVVQWAYKLHETQTSGYKQKLLEMNEYALKSNHQIVNRHLEFLEDIMKYYRAPHKNDTEDNALDRLKMIFKHVFYSQKYVVNSNTKHLETSKHYIPDYKLSYPARSTKLVDLFIVEAKLNSKSYFPHQDDFIKLRLEMQKMINELIYINLSEPMVFGLLLTGLDCQLYAMYLKYDGIYVCREVQTFSLPRSSYEIMLCPSIFSTMLALQDKIDMIIQKIQTRKKGKSSLLNLVRKGYDAPVL